MNDKYLEVGDNCPETGCNGILIEGKHEGDGCSCFQHPPCSFCCQNPIECPVCGFYDH